MPTARPLSGFSARFTAPEATGVFVFFGSCLSEPPQAARARPSTATAMAGAREGVMPPRSTRRGASLDGGDLLLLRHAERGAAAARGDDVGIVDLEAGALQRVDVVDDRSADVREARTVDEDTEPLILEHLVVLALGVERQRVLEPGAAATADAHPQAGGLHVGALGVEGLLDLLGALLGEADHDPLSKSASKASRSVARTAGR